MYKLIAILVALIPILLFLKTTLLGRSKVMKQAVSDFRKQIDYVVWAILFIAVIDKNEVHALQRPCRYNAGCWIDAKTRRLLDIQPTHWREWPDGETL